MKMVSRLIKAQSFKIMDHFFPGLKTVHPFVNTPVFIDLPVRGHDVNLFQLMAKPHREIVRIVRRRHLDDPGSEFRINKIIRDDGNFPVEQG